MKIDYGYEDSERNIDLPFPTLEPSTTNNHLPYIDAIYIPTQEHRPAPFTSLETLKKHSKRIYFLFSSGKSKWAKELVSNRLFYFTNINTYFDLDQYKKHISSQNPSACINPYYDIPAKRSFAIEHAKSHKFDRIGFLDDDIRLSSNDLLRLRMALCTSADMVSFHILSYPDVSTVDHIERLLYRKVSRVSIGGNCLFVRTKQCIGYFPFVYNDDWFFIFKNMLHSRIYSLGIAKQRPYEPWTSPTRIQFEQFGDIAIEGVKSNLISGYLPFQTSVEFWQVQINKYLCRLQGMLDLAPDCILRKRLNSALEIALELTPTQLQSFVSNYNSSNTWRAP